MEYNEINKNNRTHWYIKYLSLLDFFIFLLIFYITKLLLGSIFIYFNLINTHIPELNPRTFCFYVINITFDFYVLIFQFLSAYITIKICETNLFLNFLKMIKVH